MSYTSWQQMASGLGVFTPSVSVSRGTIYLFAWFTLAFPLGSLPDQGRTQIEQKPLFIVVTPAVAMQREDTIFKEPGRDKPFDTLAFEWPSEHRMQWVGT